VGLAGRIPLSDPLFERGADSLSVSGYDSTGLGLLVAIAEVFLVTLNTVELAVETLYPDGQHPSPTFTVSFGYGF
jgi:hypothetical protein